MIDDSGWIKIHRKILEWEWYTDSQIKSLFFHLLIKANIKEKKWRGNTVRRGDLITSYDSLHKETGISIQSIRTALQKLKNSSEVIIAPTSQYTLITLVNYDSYQGKEDSTNKQLTNHQQTANKQLTNHQQTANKQLTTTKEVKNIRSKEVKNINEDVNEKKIEKLNQEIESMKTQQIWIEASAMKIKKTPEEIKQKLSEFKTHLISIGEESKPVKDLKKHFIYWCQAITEKPNKAPLVGYKQSFAPTNNTQSQAERLVQRIQRTKNDTNT